jgi:hypothetical protein
MTRKHRVRAFLLVVTAIAGSAGTATLADAEPKRRPPPPFPAKAQAALDAVKAPDGRVDLDKLRLPMRGPDGELIRNPDGSPRLFGVNDLPNPEPPLKP